MQDAHLVCCLLARTRQCTAAKNMLTGCMSQEELANVKKQKQKHAAAGHAALPFSLCLSISVVRDRAIHSTNLVRANPLILCSGFHLGARPLARERAVSVPEDKVSHGRVGSSSTVCGHPHPHRLLVNHGVCESQDITEENKSRDIPTQDPDAQTTVTTLCP